MNAIWFDLGMNDPNNSKQKPFNLGARGEKHSHNIL